MPTIVVQLESAPKVARPRGLRAGAARKASGEAERLGKALGYDVRPMHAGSKDPALASYHVIEVPDAKLAAEVASRARGMEGVKSAYVKPLDEPPGPPGR
jgi:hypothetical protein